MDREVEGQEMSVSESGPASGVPCNQPPQRTSDDAAEGQSRWPEICDGIHLTIC